MLRLLMPGSGGALGDALRACRRHFMGVVAFSALLNLLFLVPMLYMLQVYDRVVPTRGATSLFLLTLILLYGLATLSLLDLARSRLLVRASLRLDRVLGRDVLDARLRGGGAAAELLGSQPMREFDQIRQTLTGPAMIALADLPWAPVYILVAFLIYPLLGLLILAGAVALAGIAWLNDSRATAPLQRANEAAAQAYNSLEEVVAHADVVRALGMRQAMVERHVAARSAMLSAQTEASFAGGGLLTLSRFLRLSLQSLALGLGAWLAITDRISLGAIFVASYLGSRALQPVEQMLTSWPMIARARGAYRALNDLLTAAPQKARETTRLPDPAGRIEVERLTIMAGPDNAILKSLSFAAHPGDVVAIIGPSGAGKSTLLRTLAGAGQPSSGAIRIDGASVDQWDRERLARFVGYLPQDVSLFAGTVAENIARFQMALPVDRDAVDRAVVAAAKDCGAHDLIVRLDNGYERRLGWGGSGLSAGQAQRIGLARALFGEPVLVLLDEPNAHLDADGELALGEAIRTLKLRGATVFVVSHRKDVLQTVDKIIVMRDGVIEMYGPRDEVLERLRSPSPIVPIRPRGKPAAAKGSQ